MTKTLSHRGPDNSGIWINSDERIALGHSRLSILDISSEGHQPMISPSGRYVIVYNGEIYNHIELRSKILNTSWRGGSDTETLLVCFEKWGIKKTLRKVTGMFAFALWDRQLKKLILARDRMGEKPLYYGWQSGTFLFASELKALKKHPKFQSEIDRNALTLLLRYNNIPSPHSIYKKIYKLSPGNYLTISFRKPSGLNDCYELKEYWSLKETIVRAKQKPFSGSDNEAINILEKTLRESIRRQQISDVPLGAFLSGGIDSSTIVALMQSMRSTPVNTFTIGIEDHKYNEAIYAKAVAKYLGTCHTELYIKAQDALDIIHKLPELSDEPFADSSQIPTRLVAELTRKHVTVALSGDAGDELFAGYNRYFWTNRVWRKISWLPQPLRRNLMKLLCCLPVEQWDQLNRFTFALQPKHLRSVQLGDKVHKLATRISETNNLNELYCNLISEWQYPEQVVLNSKEPKTLISSPRDWPDLDDHREIMMYLDSMTYLPDDILTKVDRATMSIGLESRVPFLDHNVIELAWRMPMHMKIRNNQGKWLLRQVLYRHVPRELIERPKMGFSIPLASWMKGTLRDWVEELLGEKKLKEQGYFDHRLVRERWNEHLNGSRNWYYSLWSVLMFQAWLENNQ